MVKPIHGIGATIMISVFKRISIIVLCLFTLIISGCGKNISCAIMGKEVSKADAKKLYDRFLKLNMYDVPELLQCAFIGGGDVDIKFTVDGTEKRVYGSSAHGIIFYGKRIYMADIFDQFFDLNETVRKKAGLDISLMGINNKEIYYYDSNKQVEYILEGKDSSFEYREELCFNVYVIGKDVLLDDLGNELGVEFDENITISEFFDSLAKPKSVSVKYKNLEIKRKSGINLWTDKEDTIFLIRKNSD